MYKQDLALNNVQCLRCHKIEPNETDIVNNDIPIYSISSWSVWEGLKYSDCLRSKTPPKRGILSIPLNCNGEIPVPEIW